MSKVLKNTTGSIVDLVKFGVTVPASGQITVVPQDYPLLGMPLVIAELSPLITAGTIIVNDGINNLSAARGINYLLFDYSQGLNSLTTNVDVSQSAAPSAGQALVAISPTAAAWSNVLLLNNIEVSDTANTTTTSNTDALLTTMSINPSAGTYLLFFSTSITSNNAGAAVSCSVYNNGTQDASTLNKIIPFDGGTLSVGSARGTVAIQRTIVVTTGSVQIRWSTSGGTATCGPRVMTMLRIG